MASVSNKGWYVRQFTGVIFYSSVKDGENVFEPSAE